MDTIVFLLNQAVEADEECAWAVLRRLKGTATKGFIAKVRLAVDMLLSTGNPVFSDVKRLATELGFDSEGKLKSREGDIRLETPREDYEGVLRIETRTPFVITIMEYPKWRISRSAWLKFLGMIRKLWMNDELRETVNKFVKRIEDNRSTTIIDDEPDVKGKGRPRSLLMT